MTLSGVILTRQNRGGAGYVIASYKRQLGDKGAWMGMDIAAGSAAFLALKSGMTLNETTGLECSATWSHIPVEWRHVLPAVEMTVKRALGVQTSGWVTYRIGEGWWFPKSTSFTSETLTAVDDSIELGLQTIHHGAQTKLSLTAASINSGMSLSHSRPMTKASSMRTFVKYNVDEGIVVGAGAERTLFSKKNRLGASVECGLMHGVFLKLR